MSAKAYPWAHMEQWNIFANIFFYALNFQAYIASGDKNKLSYSFNLLILWIENKLKWYKFMFSFAAISKENNLSHFQDNNKIRSLWQKLYFFSWNHRIFYSWKDLWDWV